MIKDALVGARRLGKGNEVYFGALRNDFIRHIGNGMRPIRMQIVIASIMKRMAIGSFPSLRYGVYGAGVSLCKQPEQLYGAATFSEALK